MAASKPRALARLGSGVPRVGELFNIIRELSFDDLRDEAELPPRLLLLGADRHLVDALQHALGGGAAQHFIEIADFDHIPSHLDSYDGIVLVNATPGDRSRPKIKQLLTHAETAGRVLTVQVPPGPSRDTAMTPSADVVADLRRRLVTRLSHRQLALGRHLPALRQDAAMSAINSTARANAEFALLSNIPTVIPIVGNLMAMGADFLVLTKNQLMLLYKLAAIHGRDLGEPWKLYTEMLPVVGAGLFWRTVARQLASLIPFAGGSIPKLLIAYAGTMVVGQSAHFYYDKDRRPSREQVQGFYARAVEMAKSLNVRDRQSNRGIIEGQFTETTPGRQIPAAETVATGETRASPPNGDTAMGAGREDSSNE